MALFSELPALPVFHVFVESLKQAEHTFLPQHVPTWKGKRQGARQQLPSPGSRPEQASLTAETTLSQSVTA